MNLTNHDGIKETAMYIRNVVLDKTAKAYAIDTTATNKMGAEVTKILGNNNNGQTI